MFDDLLFSFFFKKILHARLTNLLSASHFLVRALSYDHMARAVLLGWLRLMLELISSIYHELLTLRLLFIVPAFPTGVNERNGRFKRDI